MGTAFATRCRAVDCGSGLFPMDGIDELLQTRHPQDADPAVLHDGVERRPTVTGLPRKGGRHLQLPFHRSLGGAAWEQSQLQLGSAESLFSRSRVRDKSCPSSCPSVAQRSPKPGSEDERPASRALQRPSLTAAPAATLALGSPLGYDKPLSFVFFNRCAGWWAVHHAAAVLASQLSRAVMLESAPPAPPEERLISLSSTPEQTAPSHRNGPANLAKVPQFRWPRGHLDSQLSAKHSHWPRLETRSAAPSLWLQP